MSKKQSPFERPELIQNQDSKSENVLFNDGQIHIEIYLQYQSAILFTSNNAPLMWPTFKSKVVFLLIVWHLFHGIARIAYVANVAFSSFFLRHTAILQNRVD